jgi:coenzyme F420-reducing hydrogenase delta subunit
MGGLLVPFVVAVRKEQLIGVIAFVCENCARPSRMPDRAGRSRPEVPDFDWPVPVHEVLVPCTGRLQPEHVLKAFESGADLVCTVACEEDNCHYLEGSPRCARRVDYLRDILDQVGLGGRRLLLFHLPGTAAEDTALGAGGAVTACTVEAGDTRVAAIGAAVLQALDDLAPNPLRTAPEAEAAEDPYLQVDMSDDNPE